MSPLGASEEQPSFRWRWIGMGLAFATGATIVLEIVLTRIFSVILWYHYGFMTISLALLGLGLAGIVVYLDPQRFRRESAAEASARAGLAFAATAFLAILGFHWIVSVETHWPLGAGYRILIFLVVLVPFFFAGLAVAIPISRFTERIGALYAADLFGAAVGAIAVVPLIGWLGGHPVVIVCAGLACLSAAANAVAASRRSLLGWALLGLVICVVAVPVTVDSGLFRIRYGKHTQTRGTRIAFEHRLLVERWNSFSRVAVYQRIYRPFGWNFGIDAPRSGSYLPIRIDGGAMTPMIPFEGDFGAVEYLRYDMTSLGYQIRRPRSALIIGSGGGRDILTAKLFGVRDIRAVEVNPIIVDFVRKDFRAVSGSPYDLSGVSWTVADGRSYAAESDESFDIIQLSAVDTTAALAAGALSLVENSLYTVEAFQDYYDRLSADGLVAITRNWTVRSQEMALRTADIMRNAWRSRGHERPDRHLLIIAPGEAGARWGTLLASRRPFEANEVDDLERIAEKLGFRILFSPFDPENPRAFRQLFGPEREAFLRAYPHDVAATTDDRPFFFFFDKPFATRSRADGERGLHWGARPTPRILVQAFVLVAILVAVLGFAAPMLLGRLRLGDARGSTRGLLYFAAIGLGFIMVEIALIQRHTLLLGQPVYAFSGVLACVLVSSGLGSLASRSIGSDKLPRAASLAVLAVTLAVVAYAFAMPPLLRAAMSWPLPQRVAITLVSTVPLGFLMGIPLPLGMRAMERRSPTAIAWAWGVNGSLSVMGTVVAMMTSVFFGITWTMIAAAVAYGTATLAFGGVRAGFRRAAN